MAGWADVKGLAKAKFKVIHDDGDSFEVLFEYKTGRHQKVNVTHFDAFECTWVRFRSLVCRVEDMDPKVALAWNQEFSVGALAIIDDHYAILHSTPLDTLDPEELERPLRILAFVADKLENDYTRGRDVF
jgi:hypothetical protein